MLTDGSRCAAHLPSKVDHDGHGDTASGAVTPIETTLLFRVQPPKRQIRLQPGVAHRSPRDEITVEVKPAVQEPAIGAAGIGRGYD
jgi:hypothetical protein